MLFNRIQEVETRDQQAGSRREHHLSKLFKICRCFRHAGLRWEVAGGSKNGTEQLTPFYHTCKPQPNGKRVATTRITGLSEGGLQRVAVLDFLTGSEFRWRLANSIAVS